MCGAVNGLWSDVAPLLIFSRVNFKDIILKGAPPGSMGVAHPFGWMTGDNFDKWMQYFTHHSHCSTERPLLLLMDNHTTHVTTNSLNVAKTCHFV